MSLLPSLLDQGSCSVVKIEEFSNIAKTLQTKYELKLFSISSWKCILIKGIIAKTLQTKYIIKLFSIFSWKCILTKGFCLSPSSSMKTLTVGEDRWTASLQFINIWFYCFTTYFLVWSNGTKWPRLKSKLGTFEQIITLYPFAHNFWVFIHYITKLMDAAVEAAMK